MPKRGAVGGAGKTGDYSFNTFIVMVMVTWPLRSRSLHSCREEVCNCYSENIYAKVRLCCLSDI